MAGGVEYQVTKVDPTDPETKGMVHQVHKVSEEIAATIGGKVYRARIINDPTAPTVAGKVYQIVLIDDPDDPSVKGMVYNAILTGGSEAVVVGPAVSPLSLPDAIAGDLDYVKAFGGTEQNGTPTPTVPVDIISNNGALKTTRPSGLPAGYTALEYIESSGTQYIDTGVKVTQNNRVEVRYCYHTESSIGTSGRITGGRYTSGSPRNAFSMGTQNGKADPTTQMFSQFGTNGTAYVGPRVIIGDWFTEKTSTEGYYVNDTAYQAPIPTDDFETPYTVKLFAFEQSAPGGDPTIGCGVGRCADFKIYTNNVLTMNLVPAKNSEGTIGMYDVVNGVFYDNDGTGDFVAGPNAVDPITLTVVGTTETIATKADGEIISSATAEMLLSVGDYTDEQEIISGVVTRNVGVRVLDGTENIGKSGIYAGSFFVRNVVSDWGTSNNTQVYCSHFSGVTEDTDYAQNKCMILNNAFNMWWASDSTPTVAQFQQWLADQYAAGTPVIVIYPLATPTTESVTGQTLQVQDGDNTLEITQASIDDLELEARYDAAVTLAVQETEDANLDDNVTVTIE